MPDIKRVHWRKLDNAAKIFPATSSKKDTRVFRFYCELKERVNKASLQEALDITIEKYPLFLSVMRRGFFWFYLEKSTLKPIVKEESKAPCTTIYLRDKKTLLFEVTYFKNRINFEVFHALTDATGAVEFLKEIIKNYLIILHSDENLPDIPLTDETITTQDQESDSFSKYYSKFKKREKIKPVKSYQITGIRLPYEEFQITEGVAATHTILAKAKEYKASLTVFLTAVFFMAIRREMNARQSRKHVALMIPVNLRKIFPSNSMLNFFGWIEPEYQFKGDDSLGDIIEHVKEYFNRELQKNKMAMRVSGYISLEQNPILRFIPLVAKNWFMQLAMKLGRDNVTAIFSNIGSISLPPEYSKYIERFGFFTSTPKMELCMCSFEDQLVLSFSSCFESHNIERNFFQVLNELGVPVVVLKPDFVKEQNKKYVGLKFFQGFSFGCVALVVIFLMASSIFKLDYRVSFFIAGGTLSMWLALAIGFFKRHNLLKNAMWQLFIVNIGCIIWDIFTGWNKWSINYALPITSLVITCSIFIISKAQKMLVQEYMVYYIMSGAFGLIPFILLITGLVTVNIPSVICVGISFLFLISLFIFRRKDVINELHKNLHF